jgi:hypothetical protein
MIILNEATNLFWRADFDKIGRGERAEFYQYTWYNMVQCLNYEFFQMLLNIYIYIYIYIYMYVYSIDCSINLDPRWYRLAIQKLEYVHWDWTTSSVNGQSYKPDSTPLEGEFIDQENKHNYTTHRITDCIGDTIRYDVKLRIMSYRWSCH